MIKIYVNGIIREIIRYNKIQNNDLAMNKSFLDFQRIVQKH